MTSKLLSSTMLKAMLKALKDTKVFKIEKTKESVIVTHTTGVEVLRSLKGRNGYWLTRHVPDLFV